MATDMVDIILSVVFLITYLIILTISQGTGTISVIISRTSLSVINYQLCFISGRFSYLSSHIDNKFGHLYRVLQKDRNR